MSGYVMLDHVNSRYFCLGLFMSGDSMLGQVMPF